MLEELLTMLGTIHIDKVNNDDTTDISETQLVINLVSGKHIAVEGIVFLIRSQFARATIDIDREQGLGSFHNEVSPIFEAYRSS